MRSVIFCILAVASATRAPSKTLLAATRADPDHFVKELHDNAVYKDAEKKPMTSVAKDFTAMDRNGDGKLDTEELMFHQFATGCEPMEAQVRGRDYMTCGDLDRDGFISHQEFNASALPAWAECVKDSNLRRSHGFVKFFATDENYDNKLSKKELVVGMIKLWGQPGEVIADDFLKCADKDKDGFLNQKEFHASIAAYNPATRKWQMWNGTSNKEIISCMDPAYAKFDAALVFHATDTNKDQRISMQEMYNIMSATSGSGTMLSTVAEDIFKAADKDKDRFLNLEEFEKAGEAYKGENEATDPKPGFFLFGRAKWPTDTYNEGFGMSVKCHDRDGEEWRVFSEDLGRVKVVPKASKDGIPAWNGTIEVQQR